MKYSFMSFSCPELSFIEMLDVARKYGYDGVEPRISAKHKHGIEFDSSDAFRNLCKQQAQESAIQICCIATSCRYADPATKDANIRETHQAIDLAGDVGVPRIRVFGGPIPDGISREHAIDSVAASLRAVAEHAAERGVVVCMETHDHWCDPAHVASVMQKVNHQAIAVNWDIMHPVRTAKVTMEDAFKTLKKWIKHVHFHDGVSEDDGKGLLRPIGLGIIDHRRAVKLLKKMNYQDFLSGEWIDWEPFEMHLPRELKTIKGFE
ncbi:sugar phosphate isomerase/epimerase [candidate division KSB1 bacterium]|nr:sugar phosphate isomerase/epimerase [candidate division KSB1 bacterium]